MAGPIDRTTQEAQILARHFIELQSKQIRAESAFALLNSYNWNSTGAMPVVTWAAPTGFNFEFNPSYGELYYKGTAYSGLNSQQKREFFQYLPKFIFECLKEYDSAYNL
jgi:hypothetical protein